MKVKSIRRHAKAVSAADKAIKDIHPVPSSSRDWQPIETAPKEDRRVLLYENSAVYIGSRRIGWDWWGSDNYDYGSGKPTHWMALPDSPKP